MTYIFWICWVGEMAGVGWWLLDEMKLQYSKPNPFAFLGLIYLLTVMGVRYGLQSTSMSNTMVLLPAVPLGLVLLIGLLYMVTGGKWN
jgi:hypothetical protein